MNNSCNPFFIVYPILFLEHAQSWFEIFNKYVNKKIVEHDLMISFQLF